MVYVALLRGINVGGHNKVKMAELKMLFEKLGFEQVKTYIQSGNVLFVSNEEERTVPNELSGHSSRCSGLPLPLLCVRSRSWSGS